MTLRTLATFALLAGIASCGDGGTYLAVTVTSQRALTLTSLDVKLTNNNMTAQVSVGSGASFAIPPDQVFVIRLDGARSGRIDVDVTANDASGAVGHDARQTDIVPGGTARLTVDVGGTVSTDGGTDGPSPNLAGSCTDNTLNGSESDIDCGGSCPNKCGADQHCGVAADCMSAFCNPVTLKCGPARCVNQLKDGDESDVDCGGLSCAPCTPDHACAVDADCASASCVGAKFCALASSTPAWLPGTGTLNGVGTYFYNGPGASSPDGKVAGIFRYTSIVDGAHVRVFQYDSTAGTFSYSSYPAELPAAGLVFDPAGKLYALGGGTYNAPLKTLVVWNGTAWAALADETVGHSGVSPVIGPDGLLYAVGGQGMSTNVGDLYSYNIGTNAWAGHPYMKLYRYGCGAAVGAGKILCIGGSVVGGSLEATGEAFDLTMAKWNDIAPLSKVRAGAATVNAPDGRVYVIGGSTDGTATKALASAEAYSPAGDHWAPIASMKTPRQGAVAGIGADGRIYSFGGTYDDGTGAKYPADVEVYGPLVNVAPAMAAAGATVNVAGGNFAANAQVRVYFGPATGTVAGQGTTDGTGALTAPISITVPQVAAGKYTLTVVDSRSQYPVKATLVVP